MVEINCVADENSNCEECELNGKIICRFKPSFARKFGLLNLCYRIIACGVLLFGGLLTTYYWPLLLYVITNLLNFFLIEPWLLCSHCPYYQKQGKFLKCWALRGMPKIRKYQPSPMKNLEKTLMLIIGGFIDLFGFGMLIYYVIWYAFLTDIQDLGLFSGLIIFGVLFLALMVYLNKMLQGGTCKKCPNFACPMNKTPKEFFKVFIDKKQNQLIKDSWEKSFQ